jgi:hydrogenase large subunit
MKTVDIVERIEGEAHLKLQWENNIVKDSKIEFLNFRGFEYILEGKPPLDALVYTPRICGICGQAHLLAAVNALENIYKNSNIQLEITPKAKYLRELGLSIEIIDSHIKWFYMFIMPDITKLSSKDYSSYQPLSGKKWLLANQKSGEVLKSLALIGGQWPHTSYMIPGGVMSDPTLIDIATIENYIDQTINYFEDEIIGDSLENCLAYNSILNIDNLKGDLSEFSEIALDNNLNNIGKSYDKHFVLADMLGFKSGKLKNIKTSKIDINKIKEFDEYTFNVNAKKQQSKKYSWAKTVKYDGDFYETGPLSRALVNNRKFIKAIHKEFNDSTYTRVMSRMDELAHLLYNCKKIIKNIDISEESFITPAVKLKDIDYAKAKGCVEAARGSLLHDVEIQNGKIKKYDVTTPTVWNLGPGDINNPGVAQKAINGSKSTDEAKIVLRSFDVCSVCTTH